VQISTVGQARENDCTLIQALMSFEDQAKEVRISANGGATSLPICWSKELDVTPSRKTGSRACDCLRATGLARSSA